MSPERKPHMGLPAGTPSHVPGARTPLGRAGGMPADARLDAEEYRRWLLPPEPRDATERVIHRLSLATGVLAVTMVSSFLWFLA